MKKIQLQRVAPAEIEARSMEIIQSELGDRTFPAEVLPVVKRVIHTTADFDYAQNLWFTPGAVEAGVAALKAGTPIVTDTNMARSGVNRGACEALGVERLCYMADPEVARQSKEQGTTRAAAAVDRWAGEHPGAVFAVGNAPTALVRACELLEEGAMKPALIIGAPVGFVNVVESKELILASDVPHIVARGRKGGSNIAAAICNALLYQIER